MRKVMITKTPRIEKLSKRELQSLVFELVYALSLLNTPKDSALFLQDLLTKTEIKTLSKRLRIAKLLMKGMTYEQIQHDLHVSFGTVAKISAWLAERGEGFRKVVEELPDEKARKRFEDYSDFDSFKRKYSLYFWPELLLEEIVASANDRQKERIKNVLERLEEKSDLHKQIENLLRHNI